MAKFSYDATITFKISGEVDEDDLDIDGDADVASAKDSLLKTFNDIDDLQEFLVDVHQGDGSVSKVDLKVQADDAE